MRNFMNGRKQLGQRLRGASNAAAAASTNDDNATTPTSTIPMSMTTPVLGGNDASFTVMEEENKQNTALATPLLRPLDDDRSNDIRLDIGSAGKTAKKRKNWWQRLPHTFRINSGLGMRIAMGVLLASIVQLPNTDEASRATRPYRFFPEDYYLGGLTFAGVMVVVSCGKNLGEAIKKTLQTFIGVMMALLFNSLILGTLKIEYEELIEVNQTIDGSSYRISLSAFYSYLPALLLFTALMLWLPIEINSKKFAISMNLYFILTTVNPNDPKNVGKLKSESGDGLYDPDNVQYNFLIYLIIGLTGSFISIFTMIFPTPLIASKQLVHETKATSRELEAYLNFCVDSYSFTGSHASALTSLKFEAMTTQLNGRMKRIKILLVSVWWERLFGVAYVYHVNLRAIEAYVQLVSDLLYTLKSLQQAVEKEQYDALQAFYLDRLRNQMTIIQLLASKVLVEITTKVHVRDTTTLTLDGSTKLRHEMSQFFHEYRLVQLETFSSNFRKAPNVTEENAQEILSLNLFIFSLLGVCDTLMNFEATFNALELTTDLKTKARETLKKKAKGLSSTSAYLDKTRNIGNLKVLLAITVAIFPSVYNFQFSATAPSIIAIIMGNSLGGTFTTVANRVIGIAAGSIVPAIFQFYVCSVQDDTCQSTLNNVVIFAWISLSMYVHFNSHFASGAGLVSAFVSVSVLFSPCSTSGGIPNSGAYSTLLQTSMGVLMFVFIDSILYPSSAVSTLQHNIQDTLFHFRKSFDQLHNFYFEHHLRRAASTSAGEVQNQAEDDARLLEHVVMTIETTLPKLLDDQGQFLIEANLEPLLWRHEINFDKYAQIHQHFGELAKHLNILYRVLKWKLTQDLRKASSTGQHPPPHHQPHPRHWIYDQEQVFEDGVKDSFDTLDCLLGANAGKIENKVLYLQMKEAFRNADQDGSKTLDRAEVRTMCRAVLGKDQNLGQDPQAFNAMVDEFIRAIDSDESNEISWDEFSAGFEHGISFNVRVEDDDDEDEDKPLELRKKHDLLAIESFALEDHFQHMTQHYAKWLLKHTPEIFETYSIEEYMVNGCFLMSLSGLVQNLLELERLAAMS